MSNNKFSVRGGHGVAMCALEKVCIKTGAQVLANNQHFDRWPNTSIIFNPTSCPIFCFAGLLDPGKLSQIVEATNQCQK